MRLLKFDNPNEKSKRRRKYGPAYINSRWLPLSFGKHYGKTLPQVVLSDPDYFFWAFEEGVFPESMRSQVEEVNRKARSIRIRQIHPEGTQAEYYLQPRDQSFAMIGFVPTSQSLHEGSSKGFRKDVIDLSVPRLHKKYDKLGCRMLLSEIKGHLFGDSRYRITKMRAEEFFDNDENFDLDRDPGAKLRRASS